MSGIIDLASQETFVSENESVAIVRVARTQGSEGSGSIEYSTADGTAIAGEDYVAQSGRVFFAPNDTSKIIEIPILDDSIFEGNETFSIAVGNESGQIELGVIRTAIITIEEDDISDGNVIIFGEDSFTVSENQANAVVTINRLGDTSTTASVEFSTASDSARSQDYEDVARTIEFSPGETLKRVSIPIQNDQLPEPEERLTLKLSNPKGIEIAGKQETTLSIEDNDPIPYSYTREIVTSGLVKPTSFDWTPSEDLLFIAEQDGVIRVSKNGELQTSPFWNGSNVVNSAGQRGLLSIAVHPEFPTQPYLYLGFSVDRPGQTRDTRERRESVVVRLTADPATNYQTAIPGSLKTLLTIPDGEKFHATGDLQFGPDGMLYYTHGDGQDVVDSVDQPELLWNLDNPFGKQLRIDPLTGDGLADNPFYDGNPESLASKIVNLGLRNSFRFTFDPETGEPVLGDVGWQNWEEVNIGFGKNFGWPFFEGGNTGNERVPDIGRNPDLQNFYDNAPEVTAPLYAIPHQGTGSSIILGEFYSGYDQYPEIYHDRLFLLTSLQDGEIYALDIDRDNQTTDAVLFAEDVFTLTQLSFGQDGNLYTIDRVAGTIERWTFDDEVGPHTADPEDDEVGPRTADPEDDKRGSMLLRGTTGADKIFGLDGDDTIFGREGEDRLFGGDDKDVIYAGEDNDSVFGGKGADLLFGQSGDDFILGGDGGDDILGGLGKDTLIGGAGWDKLYGKEGSDLLIGNDGRDSLFGNGGNDVLIGNAGADVLTGHLGFDRFVVDNLSHSRLNAQDHIQDFAIGKDILEGVNAVASSDIDQLGSVTALNEASLQQILSDNFEANSAATFTLGQRTFLAINDDADGFSANRDAVIELTGFSGSLANLAIV